jgi:hypothetical protein
MNSLIDICENIILNRTDSELYSKYKDNDTTFSFKINTNEQNIKIFIRIGYHSIISYTLCTVIDNITIYRNDKYIEEFLDNNSDDEIINKLNIILTRKQHHEYIEMLL